MDMMEFYRQILAAAGMVTDEQGLVSTQIAKSQAMPAFVDNKRLCLPLREYLRADANHAAIQLFHPLNEIISRGESKVMEFYRGRMNNRLNFLIGYTAIVLLDLIIRKDEHPKLTPDQVELMVKVKHVDEGTRKRLEKITEQMLLGDDSRTFVHLFVRRNAKIGGKLYQRAGVVTFPFYEEICKTPEKGEENEIYGVALRKSDRAALKAMMEFLLPGIETPDNFSRGCNSHVAPTLEALLRAAVALYDPLNTALELYKDVTDLDDLLIPSEWEPVINDLAAMLPQIRMVPNQPGNEGRDRLETHLAPALNAPAHTTPPTLGAQPPPTQPVSSAEAMLPPLAPTPAPILPPAPMAVPLPTHTGQRTLGISTPTLGQGAPTLAAPVRHAPPAPRPMAHAPQGFNPTGYAQPQAYQPPSTHDAHGFNLASVLGNRAPVGGFQSQQGLGGGRSAAFNNLNTRSGGFGGGFGI
jgi:hypothetical protein